VYIVRKTANAVSKPELLYQVTEDDVVVGSIERGRAHTEEVLHRSGIIFLIRSDQEVLLQFRSAFKDTFPARFDASSSFHVLFRETYQEAAEREMREELNVSAPLMWVTKFIHHDPPEHQIVAVFTCKSDAPIKIDPSEASNAAFYSKEEIDRIIASANVTPWLRDGWPLARATF